MSDNLKMVLVGAVVLVALGLILGPRLKKAKFNIFKIFKGEVQGSEPGASVERAEAWGEDNKITADGAGASVKDARAIGKGNQIGASTAPPPVNPNTKRKS
jgi:hypothetical protein